MLKNIFYNRKIMVPIFIVAIVGLTLVALVPMFFSIFTGPGVTTEPINADKTKPASTEVDGEWKVVKGNPNNFTSVGFTFAEILPAEQTVTSGSTDKVTGQAEIADGTVESAMITIDMDELTTDKKVRDQNMKSKLFETGKFPESTFELTEPVDISAVPEDGSLSDIELTGDLTIKGKTETITETFQVARDGETILIGGNIPINRLDFDVVTPDMIAAKIDEEGTVDIRLTMKKSDS